MSDDKTKKDPMFVLEATFNDLSTIFDLDRSSVEDICGSCEVVLDTNTLLMPYRTGTEEFNAAFDLYERLKEEERIHIPTRVVREYRRNQPVLIKDFIQKLEDNTKAIQLPSKIKTPLLDGSQHAQGYKDAYEKVKEANKAYLSSVEKLRSDTLALYNQDPVMNKYKELFLDCLTDEIPLDTVKKDAEYRLKNNVPPGYKDKSKADGGVGDVAVWLTILEIAKTKNNDLIFVTGDNKADWMYRVDKNGILPRVELSQEYTETSQGKTFHMMQLSDFLQLFKVDSDTVKRVRKVEENVSANLHKSDYLISISKVLRDFKLKNSVYLEVGLKLFQKYRPLSKNIKNQRIGKSLDQILHPICISHMRSNALTFEDFLYIHKSIESVHEGLWISKE